MGENWGKISLRKPVWKCSKISRKE